jgi:hypothetical protein
MQFGAGPGSDLNRSAEFKPAYKAVLGPEPDPHVFGPHASGSNSHWYGSGSGSFPFLVKVLSGLK